MRSIRRAAGFHRVDRIPRLRPVRMSPRPCNEQKKDGPK